MRPGWRVPTTMTTTGQTSEPVQSVDTASAGVKHTADLIERHRIVINTADLPTGAKARTDVARLHAEAWARAHGLELGGMHSIAGSSLFPESCYNGVEFEVTVGKGEIALDQRVPGVLDRWKWSARMEHWRRVFTGKDGRQGRRLAAREDVSQRVLRGPWEGVDRLHDGHLSEGRARVGSITGGVLGCTCHLGGPFVDICPVHFEADS